MVKEDPAAVAAREQAKRELEEKMKWVWMAGGVGFIGFAVWQFVRETAQARCRANRPRQPWEML